MSGLNSIGGSNIMTGWSLTRGGKISLPRFGGAVKIFDESS